jgi:hypothetical protein
MPFPTIHRFIGCVSASVIMVANLANSELGCQVETSLLANGHQVQPAQPWTMERKKRTGRKGRTIYPGPDIQLGPWLARLGISAVELARGVKITAPHVSELISHKKRASTPLSLAISDFLGITVNELYGPPPSKEAMESARSLSPAQQALVARLLEQNKR